jgi:IMP dehydrogenase
MVDEKFKKEGLTFDDVLLIPQKSSVLPSEVDIKVHFAKDITLNIPILSSPMDTVTEWKLAIALAQEGGIGIIHMNMPIEEQASQVGIVKRSVSGMIIAPITISPDKPVSEAIEIMHKYKISGVPVTEGKKLVGILTHRDLRFEKVLTKKVGELMTKNDLITVPMGTTLEQASEILHNYRIEKLPVVDDEHNLMGLITFKDIELKRQYPNACKDKLGRLRVGAALGISKDIEKRADALAEAGVDVFVIDSAHGHSKRVLDALTMIKKRHPDIVLIGGNVATADGCEAIIDTGADAVRVGMGPGSTCTTRIVAGTGIPQITAIYDCANVADKKEIAVIADGGIRYSGDITKAMAAGARITMIGNLFAGTDESPGDVVFYEGRSFKIYRGMGSLPAMKAGGGDRYFQDKDLKVGKLVPEGIVGRVPYKGSLSAMIYQLIGGIRSGMGFCGASNIEELRKNSKFVRISHASIKENHPHDIIITEDAPNYF